MNPVSAITNGFGSVIAAIRNRVQDARLAVSLIPSYLANLLWLIDHKFLTLARQGYGQNAVVYAVLRVLSSAVAEPPIVLYTVDSRGAHKRVEQHDHPVLVLLDRPNELMTQYEFWELTTLHCGIAGHAFWWKERDHVGNVLALWPLRPDRVGPIYSTSDQEGEHALLGWSYQVPGTTQYIPVPRRDVIAFNLPDPSGESGGMIEGIGPLQVLSVEVGADNEASKFVGNLLANYATPSLVIKTKVPLVSEEDAKRLKAGWKMQFGGMMRGEPAILDADSEVQQIAWSLDKLEFPDLRGISESRIAAAFGVPAILVGLRTGLQEGIRATISEQREYFAETTLANYWRRFSDQVSSDLASEYGENLVLRFDTTQVKALQLQTRQQKQPVADAWNAGVALLDEYREHVLNLPPLGPPFGTLLKWQTTDVPNQTGEGEDDTGQIVPMGTKRSPRRPIEPWYESNGHYRRTRTNGHTATKARPKVSSRQRAANASAKAAVSTTLLSKQYEPRIRHLLKATHDSMVGGFAGTSQKNITMVMSADAGGKAKRIERTVIAIKATADDAFSDDSEQYITELEQLIAELQIQGVQDGYDSLSGEPAPPNPFNLQNKYVSAAVDSLASKIKDVSDTTRQNVRDVIQKGIDDGLSIPDIAALLRDSEAFSDYRATMIARTESRVAYNQGAVAAMRDLGANYVYIDDGDEDDPCAEVSGTVQTVDWFDENPTSHPNAVLEGSTFVPYGDLQEMIRARYSGEAITLDYAPYGGLGTAEGIGQIVHSDAACTVAIYDGTSNGLSEIRPLRRTTIGPNHPVLTTRGFVRAAELKEGDYLIYDSRANNPVSAETYFQQVPAVEDIFTSLIAVSGYTSVPATADDFHGDGQACQGEVDVVRPERNLLEVWNLSGIEEGGESVLVGANAHFHLEPRSGANFLYGGRVLLAATSRAGSIGITVPGHPFTTAQVIGIERSHFEGWAFDATTQYSLYCSDGLVVSNCTRAGAPVPADEEADAVPEE